MRKLLKSLACFATAALVGASAFANYGWYDTSIGIGGIKSHFQDWSRGNGDPDTDLGALTSLTLSSVEMNIWDDANDRGGVNMFFRLYGADGQIGGDVDVWLGGAERIEGSVHDFSVSYTGPFDLADAFGVTLEDGKTYYLNMWAKSYKNGGTEYDDHWYNGDGDNYHTKFVYCGTPKTYTLVESADDLVVGADYLVVSTVDGAYSAMKNEANSVGIECLGLADDAISGNTISAASDAIVWQIKEGEETGLPAQGLRVLYNAAANVFAADSDDLAGRAQLLADDTDALAQWTIDTSALPAVKFYSVSYPDRCLQRDNFAANERFAAYEQAHVAPCLYRADSTQVQTVTFDGNGGTPRKASEKYVLGGEYWGIWSAIREGYKFLRWVDEDGNPVRNYMEVTGGLTKTLTAQWAETQTVSFNSTGGSEKEPVECAGIYTQLTSPTWAGHKFLGWFDAADGNARVRNGDVLEGGATRTLYAHWAEIQTVSFDSTGGSAKDPVECAGIYTQLTSPTWAGHKFLGWFDAADGNARVRNGDAVEGGATRTLYAHWAETQTVSFDSTGGSAKDPVVCAGIYTQLTSPTWAGHKFLGWFDAADGNARVRNGDAVEGGATRTLYAHWTEIVAASASRAKAGARDASTVTDILNYAFTGISGTGYAEWSGKKSVSEALYAGQSGGQNDSIQLRSNNSNSGIVTTKSGGKARKVTVTWNGNTSNGRTLNVYGKNSAYSQATDLYNASSQGTLIGTIVYGTSTELSITDDYEFIGMRSSSSAMYLSEVKIDWEVASSDQSVTLSPAGPIEAEVGDEVIITATADGFSGDVTWSWTGSGTPDGNRFTVDTSAAVEAATITATATSGTETASQSVTVTVTAPKHTITIDSAIVNGSITTTPAGEAAEGALVTVIPSPASGYQLGFITVNGDDLAAGVTTFTMPTENVTVSATFVEYVAPDFYFQFESDDLPGSYTAGNVNFANTGSTAADAPTVAFTLQRGIAGDLDGDKKVGNVALRLGPTSGDGFARNATAFSTPLTKVSFQYAKYGTDSCTSFKVQVSSDGANWQDLADLTSTVTDTLQTYTSTSVPEGSTFIRFIATNTGSSNNRRLNVDEIQLWLAAPVVEPTVTLSPSEAEVLVGGTLKITATAENFSGAVTWDWDGEDGGSFIGNEYTVDTSVDGTFDILATASCGSEYAEAWATVTVKNPPTAHDIEVDYGDGSEGTASVSPVSAFEGDTVTLTVTPATGYAVDTITASEYTSLDPIAVDPDTLTFVMPDDDVYVEVTFKEAVTYTLVESADDFVVGADYVIVASGNGFTEALKNAANGNRIGTEAVTVSDDGKTIENPSAAIVWQIKEGEETGLPAKGLRLLYNAAANVYAAAPASAGNNAQLIADDTDALAQWTIDLSALPEVKIYSASYTDRYLQRNNTAGNHYFATYNSAQATPRLYRADSTQVQTVTFDGNGGTPRKASEKYVLGGEYWGIWSAIREGYKFLRWVDEDGNPVRNYMEVTGGLTKTLTAQWAETQTVSFNSTGGSEKEPVECAGIYTQLTSPTWAGHKFLGWFDAADGNARVRNGDVLEGGATRTLYAHWAEIQTVSFDSTGGSAKDPVECAGIYTQLTSPTWAGHKFLGWFDAADGDARIRNGDPLEGGATRTLYAHWAETQTVSFDSTGGSAKDPVVCAVIYTQLTSPTWAGHKFLGWFDAADGNARVRNGDALEGGATRTLYAHWAETGLSITSFGMKSADIAARDVRSAGKVVELRLVAVAGVLYEVQWAASLDAEWTVLKSWTAEEDGETTITVSVPADAPSGFFRLVAPAGE